LYDADTNDTDNQDHAEKEERHKKIIHIDLFKQKKPILLNKAMSNQQGRTRKNQLGQC